jgi:hypothetical protein
MPREKHQTAAQRQAQLFQAMKRYRLVEGGASEFFTRAGVNVGQWTRLIVVTLPDCTPNQESYRGYALRESRTARFVQAALLGAATLAGFVFWHLRRSPIPADTPRDQPKTWRLHRKRAKRFVDVRSPRPRAWHPLPEPPWKRLISRGVVSPNMEAHDQWRLSGSRLYAPDPMRQCANAVGIFSDSETTLSFVPVDLVFSTYGMQCFDAQNLFRTLRMWASHIGVHNVYVRLTGVRVNRETITTALSEAGYTSHVENLYEGKAMSAEK